MVRAIASIHPLVCQGDGGDRRRICAQSHRSHPRFHPRAGVPRRRHSPAGLDLADGENAASERGRGVAPEGGTVDGRAGLEAAQSGGQRRDRSGLVDRRDDALAVADERLGAVSTGVRAIVARLVTMANDYSNRGGFPSPDPSGRTISFREKISGWRGKIQDPRLFFCLASTDRLLVWTAYRML